MSRLSQVIWRGIYLYGLEPASERIAWKRVLSKSPAIIGGTERTEYRIVPSSALNDILRSDGNLLSLPAGLTQRFTFDSQMTDAELKQKLQTNQSANETMIRRNTFNVTVGII